MRPKVFATRRIPSPGIELISKECDVTVYQGSQALDREELLASVREIDGLVCIPGDRIDAGVFDAAPSLKVVSTCSVGYEHIDVAEATKRGIYVGYTPEVLTDATADLAFALLMTAGRRTAEGDRFVRAGKWAGRFDFMFMLGAPVWEATLGIIGFGRIGRAMAARARGFNMKVLYSDAERATAEDEQRLGAAFRDLDALLAESDFVSIHVPYSKATHHLIDERTLKAMKKSAILVNTSRGPVVDEAALATALKEGWIAGAGLDVYEKEPLDAASPLLQLENVALSPHIGSATGPSRSKMGEMTARNLLAGLKGEPMPHCLNPGAR